MQATLAYGLPFVQNAFANYVVQHVLAADPELVAPALVDTLLPHLLLLCSQKFSSNVVEKCLQLAPPVARERLFAGLRAPDVCGRLCFDMYGNYVMQSALRLVTPEQREPWAVALAPILNSMTYAPDPKVQKIRQRLQQLGC